MLLVSSNPQRTSVGAETFEYSSMVLQWRRARAVISGEAYAKAFDAELDLVNFENLLVPFSPKMPPQLYRWFVAEAQLPGLVSQYHKVVLGGLLRKVPQLSLPEGYEALEPWLRNHFTAEGNSLVSFLSEALSEELTTSRCFVSVDFPRVADDASDDERAGLTPYPVIWKAEDLINWHVTRNPVTGRPQLSRAIFRYVSHRYSEDNPFHPSLVPTVADHHLDESGNYVIDFYEQESTGSVRLSNGELSMFQFGLGSYVGEGSWRLYDSVSPRLAGEPLGFLPIFPLSGELRLQPPMFAPLVDKEVSLYNKVSRRNHLLLGAATYTPYLTSDMQEEEFRTIVQQGLGTWMKLDKGDTAGVLETPTGALSDYERAIDRDLQDLAQLGIRILSPEAGESGIALEIRNSTQLAQLGLLNTKVSSVMRTVLALMITWRTGTYVGPEDLDFQLSADFDPSPLGGDWMRMITEWYQSRLIPRGLWLKFAKQHDILPPDYNDEEGIKEIGADPVLGAAAPAEEVY